MHVRGARSRRATLATAAAAAAVALLAACSSSAGSTAGGATGSTGPGAGGSVPVAATGASATRPPCNRPAAAPPTAAAVEGVASDHDITSFDGTTIRAHWFPVASASAANPAPTVLMGPGWSLPGDTNADAVGVLGAINIATLRDAGFNVLTWDPRGFGKSTGSAQVNDPEHEGRDVQALMDWVAAQPGVQLDAPGDPRMGMVGGSYGGGIQLVTASIDCRVDAIVPVIAWHSLESSLFKADTVKAGWAGILQSIAASKSVDPHVPGSYQRSMATGKVDPDDRAWFVARGPGEKVADVRVPTLLIQGTVDGLFTLDEAITNYQQLEQAGTPVSMLWYCGGHGVCLTKAGDPTRTSRAAIAWLRHHVKGESSVDVGPRIDIIDQDGTRYTGADWPLPAGPPLTATGSGTLSLTADGGSGPTTDSPADSQLLWSLVKPITPAKAANAVNVPIANGTSTQVIVGAPTVELTYSGTSPSNDRPARVFAQLVDDSTGVVLGNQVTPVEITLDGQSHTVKVPLEVVAFTARPGATLTLQLTPTTVAYAQPQLGGTVTFDKIAVSLPTVEVKPAS